MRHAPGVIATVVSCLLFAHVPSAAAAAGAAKYVWVQIGPLGLSSVRAITTASICPQVRFDRSIVRMSKRAPADSEFNVLTCEATIPAGTQRIEVAGKALRAPSLQPRRIAVIGDTGCRLKAGEALDNGFQRCNDPDDWEFAKVARRVATSNPDLIIHVGDYIYREQPCDGTKGCEGSPFNGPGMRWHTWEADFFAPAAPMLQAAPILFVRGDHEQCERAGSGFFRFLDAYRLRQCLDFTQPYAVDFTGLQLIVMDTVQAIDTVLSPQVVRDRYEQDFKAAARLITGNAWLLSHRPIWGIRPTTQDGSETQSINVTVQDALRQALGRLPPNVELVLTGHIHLAEALSFTGGRPPQIIAGIGGTKLLPEVARGSGDKILDGERITHITTASIHGFIMFERSAQRGWKITIQEITGQRAATCTLASKSVICTTE